MKYRKKPVIVHAFKIDGSKETLDNLLRKGFRPKSWKYDNGKIVVKINTLEGVMTAHQGDYIIKGVKGEFYPCKPDIFEKTYEKVVK